MLVKSIALLWGFAEATLFFIVPDVWLTIVGRDNLKRGLLACLYSLGGALIGGIVIYFWGKHDLLGVLSVMDIIPGIGSEMINSVNDDLRAVGATTILLGPLTGMPYKLYAAQAFSEGVGLWAFVLITVPARLVRFVLVTLLAHYLVNWVVRKYPSLSKLWLISVAWIIFYAFYFVMI